jgi:hypothetical protein
VDWQPIVGLLIGLYLIARGIAVKRGTWRGFEPLYRNAEIPTLARNSPFALLPLGLMVSLGIVAGLSAQLFEVRAVTLALFSAVPILFLIALAVALRPPAFMKPRWIVEEETAGATSLPLQGFDVLFGAFLGIVGILMAASFVFLLIRG